jgi:hypothetical protein
MRVRYVPLQGQLPGSMLGQRIIAVIHLRRGTPAGPLLCGILLLFRYGFAGRIGGSWGTSIAIHAVAAAYGLNTAGKQARYRG